MQKSYVTPNLMMHRGRTQFQKCAFLKRSLSSSFGAHSLSTHFSQCIMMGWGKPCEVSSLLREPHTFIWLGQLLTSLTFTRSHLQVNPPLTKGGLGILCARLRKEAISFLLFIWFPFRLRSKATFKLAYPTSPFIQFGIPYTKLEKAS